MRIGYLSRGLALTLLAALGTSPTFAKNSERPMFKDTYVKVNGVRLHCVTEGKGPLILFLHGFPEFWYEWKDQLAEFGKDHLAVAPDMRGYNLSEKPAELDQYKINVLV